MIMRQTIFFVLAFSFFFIPALFSVQAAVTCPANFTVIGGVCVPTKASTGLSDTSVSTILETFMNWLLGIFGFLSVIAFVISGVQYLVAAGDEDTAKTAKRNMQYAIIGIVVALSGLVILTAINAALQGGANY